MPKLFSNVRQRGALNLKTKPWMGLCLVLTAVGAFFVDNSLAAKATETKRVVYTPAECLRCHYDEKGVKMMQQKAGDPHYMQKEAELYRKFHPQLSSDTGSYKSWR